MLIVEQKGYKAIEWFWGDDPEALHVLAHNAYLRIGSNSDFVITATRTALKHVMEDFTGIKKPSIYETCGTWFGEEALFILLNW